MVKCNYEEGSKMKTIEVSAAIIIKDIKSL